MRWPLGLDGHQVDDDPGTDGTAADRSGAARGAVPVVGRKGIEERLDALFAEQQLVAGHTSRVLAMLESGTVNEVMETATRTIPAPGFLERRFQAPFAGLAVVNPSAATITVQEGAAGSAAQGDGPGSFLVPPGSVVVLPLVGRFLNFYATAGTRFSYTVLAKRPEPAGALAGVSTASGTGIAGGTVTSTTGTASTAAVTNVTSVALAANTARKGATFTNEGAATVYLALAATAATTAYTAQLVTGAYYELPYGYTGPVSVITSAGAATVRVTELT